MIESVLFYTFAALALVSAVVVIAQKSPFYSAFGLIVVLCSLSGIFAVLGSPFIAVIQLVVYAGAIMVLFLFVLMLLNVQRETDDVGGSAPLRLAAAALASAFAAQVAAVIARARIVSGPEQYEASTRKVAELLFSPAFLYVFEATSILILAALVGAIVLAKRDL
ncbi:MAG: NADH-quinone oxidoreductase subunit J [Vicinamibacteria bacterium]|nr:NADH-quinone oxidoreductase subunit J [Vicinamibacteria bacterium]